MFKRVLVVATLLCAAAGMQAQQMPPTGGHPPMKDQEPPASPPETASATIAGATIAINYSSPRVKGREGHIFTPGGLIQTTHKSYPVWRAGANSATTLKTRSNIMIGDLMVPAGTYTLFVDIVNPAQWVLVVSKATGEWGLDYDKSKDLGRTKMKMSKPPALVEDLVWTIKPTMGKEGTITLAWENKKASVPVMVH